MQRPGLEIGDPEYKPEPDVAVIDHDFGPGIRIATRAYLLAEVVSSTDRKTIGPDRSWIDEKRDLYRAHDPCHAILVISQDHMEVALDTRTDAGWQETLLGGPDAELCIPAFGLRSCVAELYEQTSLAPRHARHPHT